MASYKPDQIPEFNAEVADIAKKLRLKAVQITCEESDAKSGDSADASFIAYLDCVPRIGEEITLQDKTHCVVTRVIHQVVKVPDTQVISAIPTVIAVRDESRKPT